MSGPPRDLLWNLKAVVDEGLKRHMEIFSTGKELLEMDLSVIENTRPSEIWEFNRNEEDGVVEKLLHDVEEEK